MSNYLRQWSPMPLHKGRQLREKMHEASCLTKKKKMPKGPRKVAYYIDKQYISAKRATKSCIIQVIDNAILNIHKY